MVCLIKPLYEGLAQTAPQDLARIGSVLTELLQKLSTCATRRVRDLTVSPILGGRGALEFLVWLSPHASASQTRLDERVARALDSAQKMLSQPTDSEV
jgi:hypothetical protein